MDDTTPPPSDETPPPSDDPPPPTGYALNGMVYDYSDITVPVAEVTLSTIGMSPTLQGISDLEGKFSITGIPEGSVFYLQAATAGELYVPTVNPDVTVEGADVNRDAHVVSKVYHDRQYTTLNEPPPDPAGTPYSIVIGDLRMADGQPWEGLGLAEVQLTDEQNQPIPGVLGPYFIGETGDVNALLLQSTAFNGAAKVAFLRVPTGTAKLNVSVEEQGVPMVYSSIVHTVDFGATLTAVHQTMPGMDPPPPGGTTFEKDIYPIFQRAVAGGQGCASCHTAGGLGAILILDDGAQAVYERLTGNPLYVNLETPAESLILTKPLYEDPPNHPNATWLTTENPYYQKILLWIEAGALQ